jgi:putative ABC transport system permease protein
MSRVVETGRMMIGTLKAFGYSKLKIYTYFLSYAFIVVILGNLIGIFLSGFLASGMMELLLSSLTLPEFQLKTDYLSIFKSIVLTTVICVGTAAVVCASEIRNSPTECMRPKSPKAGTENILERIRFLWSIMSFAQKTVTRNIFRNKARMLMCVFGVAGCMAITLAGFGLRDSINATTNSIFTNMYKYDVNVLFKNDVTLNEATRISKLTDVDKAENVMMAPIRILKDRKSVDTTANILEDKVTLMLPSLKVQDSMTMPEDGLILSSTLAKDLNLKRGEIIDIILAGNTDIIKVKVSEYKDNISGCYLSKSVWRKLGQEYKTSGVYVKTKDVKSFVAKTKEYDFVSTVILESEIVDSTNSETSVLNTVTVVFIFFGGVLGLVVLYNLGILNYFERMRELATLKVLGFIPREIKALVLTENIIFTIIGIALGIPLGIALTSFLVAKSPQKSMNFITSIKLTSFIYSAGLTMMFSLFVNNILGKKLNKIDMLGSLKSVE